MIVMRKTNLVQLSSTQLRFAVLTMSPVLETMDSTGTNVDSCKNLVHVI